jgi:hypothetical protein
MHICGGQSARTLELLGIQWKNTKQGVVRLRLMVVICPSTVVKLLSIVLRRWFRLIGWLLAVARL